MAGIGWFVVSSFALALLLAQSTHDDTDEFDHVLESHPRQPRARP